MALINTYYFASKDVKVFPSSFRGTYAVEAGADELVFDPESRLNTEANFILPKSMLGKSTYILEYNQSEGIIKFMLGGYYFEISNLTSYVNSLKDKLIGITTRSVNFDVDSTYDGTRTSHVLDSWIADNDNLLDKFTDINSKQSYFTGLKVLTAEDTATSYIKLFNNDGTVNQTYMLANIDHGTGSNTLMHGTGLTAGYTNQTVFGKHNYNKSDSIFEIGKGADSSNKANALEISATTTTINNATNINGNTIITGSTKIEGTAEITNNAEIKGELSISKDTESISTTTGALKVTGGVGIGKNLNVGGDTNLGSVTKTDNSTTPATTTTTPLVTIKNAPSTSEPNVKIDGTLTVTRKTDIYGNATIDSNKTTLAKPVEITDTTISTSAATGALKVSGGVGVAGNLNIGGNITLAGTVTASGEITENSQLITKSYLETHISNTINTLDVASVGTSGSYLKTISETDGKISATTQTFDTSISNTSTNDNAPTSKAVNDAITTAINNLNTTSVGSNGSYLKTIGEANGIITAATQTFDNSINSESTDNNAPTTKAVYDFVEDYAKDIWSNESKLYDIDKNSGDVLSTTNSLKNIILNATYPVGSIYIMYSESSLAECPIHKTLGGEWEAIEKGRFLVAATKSVNDTYTYAKKDGSADAIVVAHLHEFESGSTASTTTAGAHTHSHNQWATAHDASKDNCFRSANSGKSGGINVNITTGSAGNHTHSIDLSKVKTKTVGSVGTNKNLPPYLAVYMWKRTA